jgi:hypothetical protein
MDRTALECAALRMEKILVSQHRYGGILLKDIFDRETFLVRVKVEIQKKTQKRNSQIFDLFHFSRFLSEPKY